MLPWFIPAFQWCIRKDGLGRGCLEIGFSNCLGTNLLCVYCFFYASTIVVQVFQDDLSSSIIEQLAVLQECNETHVHTSVQRVFHHIERRLYQTIDAKLGSNPASERVLQQLAKRRSRNSDGQKGALDALQDLRGILRCVKRQRSNAIPVHMTFSRVGRGQGLVECKNSDLEFPSDEEIKEDMFKKVQELR